MKTHLLALFASAMEPIWERREQIEAEDDAAWERCDGEYGRLPACDKMKGCYFRKGHQLFDCKAIRR